jgi:energy-coupling factor transporter transmembrane protein EcfT
LTILVLSVTIWEGTIVIINIMMNRLIDGIIAKIPLWLSIPLLVASFVFGSFINTSHYKIGLNKDADLAKIVKANDLVAYLSVLTIEEDNSKSEAIADTKKDEDEDKTFSTLIGDYEISYDIVARRKSDNAMIFRFDNSSHFESPSIATSVSHKTHSHQHT